MRTASTVSAAAINADTIPVTASQAVMCAQSGIRALATAGGLPDAAELRARKAEMDKGGSPPTQEPEGDKNALALAKARLELLKNM